MSANGVKSNEVITKRKKSKDGSALTKRAVLDEEKKANIVQWAIRVHTIKCKTIVKEYPRKMHNRFVPVGVTYKAGETYPNYHKFRYSGEKCIDQTRVVLKNRGKDSDFIHANWVGSPAPGAIKYICTQAPLKETQEDFWHMCFTEKVSLILMLCNFTEGSDFETSSHYFPEKKNETLKFGSYTVTMKDKLKEPEIEKTEFTVMEIKYKGETVTVKHCFMRYWLDICPPVETEPILKLWRWVRKYHNNQPVAVLCAAGVGRAPTFAGIELAAHRIASKPEMSQR